VSRYVWEVRATSAEPIAELLRASVTSGLENVRTLAPADTHEAWFEDVIAWQVLDVAVDGTEHSVLVDVEVYDARADKSAAIISGVFDEAVLGRVMDIPSVTTCTHSDRIKREAHA
jgi:hypothetical protein